MLVFFNIFISRENSTKLLYLILIMSSRLLGLIFFTVAQDFRYAFVVHIIFLVLLTKTITNLATFLFADSKKNVNVGK